VDEGGRRKNGKKIKHERTKYLSKPRAKSVSNCLVMFNIYTAEPAYSRLQGNNEYSLLKEKSTKTGIEK